MKKKIGLIGLFFLLFFFSSANAVSSEINRELTGVTLTSMVINISDRYFDDFLNTTEHEIIVLDVRGDLNITFADNTYLINNYNKEPDNNIMGVYSNSQNEIVLDMEKIYNRSQNYPDSELYDLVQNTLLHEISHYLDTKSYMTPIFLEDYNIEVSSGTLENPGYFVSLTDEFSDNPDLPLYLYDKIDMEKVYDGTYGYTSDDYVDETIARMNSLCVVEDKDYNSYWEMFTRNSQVKICVRNFTISSGLVNNMNSVGKDIIETYYFDYLGKEAQFYEVEETTRSGFDVISNIINSWTLLLEEEIIITLTFTSFFIFIIATITLIIRFIIRCTNLGLCKKTKDLYNRK